MSTEHFTQPSPSKEISSQSMSKTIFLSELQPATPERSTIRFRIVRMWQDYIFNDKQKQGDDRKFGIGYIIADAKGNFAHAKLSTYHEKDFKHKLIEKSVYDMSLFNVHPCKKGYNVTKTNSMIRFDKCTKIRPIQGTFPSIPTQKPFEFVKFDKVVTMLSNEFLIDVVGFLSSFSSVNNVGEKKVRYINLQDEKGEPMKVSIWDEQIELFDENKVQDQCVLVLTSVSVSKYNGDITISTKPSTVIYYDLDIPEVTALKQSGLLVETKYVENKKAEYVDWKDYRRTTLGEMIEQYNGTMEKGVSNTIDCTITKFWRKWFYMACEQCLAGVGNKDNKVRNYCKSCNKTTKTFQAYNANVEIADEEHSYEATIWAPTLEDYFHVDVHEIQNMITDGCVPENMFREKLENKKGTFQISMKTYMGKMSLSVLKFSPLSNVIGQYSEDDHSFTFEGSPNKQGLIEYSNMNNSSEMVSTPSKAETVVSKKRKAQRNLEDGKEHDGSEKNISGSDNRNEHDGGSDDGEDCDDGESGNNSNEDESTKDEK